MMHVNSKTLARALLLICTTSTFGDVYKIRGAGPGTITIALPETTVVEKKEEQSNTLNYFFKNEESNLQLTFFPESDVSEILTDEKIRSLVLGTEQDLLNSAVEDEIQLSSFNVNEGAGFYYSITDKQPKPDEYKYRTQGRVRFGEISGSFTVLHNDESMKQNSLWVGVLKTLQYNHEEVPSSHFDKLKLTSRDIENMATFSDELHLYSTQTTTLYNNPETYLGIMPKCIAKEYQSVSDGNSEGSILYFRFDANIEGIAIDFLTGLLYGEPGKPDIDHPEIIEVKNDRMIIYSFPYNNSLSEKVQKLVTPRL